MYYQNPPRMDHYFRKKPLGDWAIGSHLHSFFELQCCVEGVIDSEIAGRHYRLHPGEVALIFPYQPHSFTEGGKGYLFTFEPELIGTFAERYANYLPENSQFPFTWDFDAIEQSSDIFTIKAFLYSMCIEAARMKFVYAPADSRILLEKIFLLTETHFADCDFSLEQLSVLLDYDYSYLSKYFFKKTGMRYSDYLTRRRIRHAEKLLRQESRGNIAAIALACGYGSIRSFNRNFKKIHNTSPQGFQSLLSSQR